MKGVLKKAGIVVFIFFLIFFVTYVLNERFISLYEDKEYDKVNFSILKLNLLESYKSHYNQGNKYYQEKEYKEAIKEYEKSLKLFPSHDDECKIRINLALAKLELLDYKVEKEEDVKKLIKELKKVQKVLTKKGCAKKNGKGHSKKAQKLYDDIQAYIEQLKQSSGGSGGKNDPDDPDDPDEPEDPEDPEDPDMNMINEIESGAMENVYVDPITEYKPYSGKPW